MGLEKVKDLKTNQDRLRSASSRFAAFEAPEPATRTD
jgi:hypothetical protein